MGRGIYVSVQCLGSRRHPAFSAVDLHKAKDLRKPVSVPQLTAAQDDLDSSTHVAPSDAQVHYFQEQVL